VAGGQPAGEHDHELVLPDQVLEPDHAGQADRQAGLLQQLAPGGVLDPLARLGLAAGQAPEVVAVLVAVVGGQHLAVVDDQGPGHQRRLS
jgi:hypothetical protein